MKLMKIIVNLNHVKRLKIKYSVITWGVFDGVHRGHQKIIRALVKQARQQKSQSLILTFQHHPDKVLGKAYPLDITSLEHRLRLFKQLGVDIVVVCPFNKRFSQMTPADFIKHILIGQLKAQGIVVSPDTRFGQNRSGHIQLLKKLCREYRLQLRIIPLLKYRRRAISSTRIRQAIYKGDINAAKVMLGRPVSLLGRVIKGLGRGRQLGFPTANLEPQHELTLPYGVYATQVPLKNRIFNALTNIGVRPTFRDKLKLPTVETYLIGFNRPPPHYNLYGQELEVKFIARIRDERKFESADELIVQMKKDKERLQQYVAH